jgi:hypothetical protein
MAINMDHVAGTARALSKPAERYIDICVSN